MFFDVDKFVETARGLARVKDVAWRWCGDDYTKPVRSLGPDKTALARAWQFLELLALVAPNGYPSFACLRAAIMRLDDEFNILEDLDARPQMESASLAADIWRKMMRDVLTLKRSGGFILHGDLRRVVDMIVPQREAAIAGMHPLQAMAMGSPSDDGSTITGDDDSMTGDLDSEAEASDDVEIARMVCRCPGCRAANPLVVESDVASDHDGGCVTEIRGDDDDVIISRPSVGVTLPDSSSRYSYGVDDGTIKPPEPPKLSGILSTPGCDARRLLRRASSVPEDFFPAIPSSKLGGQRVETVPTPKDDDKGDDAKGVGKAGKKHRSEGLLRRRRRRQAPLRPWESRRLQSRRLQSRKAVLSPLHHRAAMTYQPVRTV